MISRVGPVLRAGPVADAIARAIVATNDDVSILDAGAYLRVEAPGRCQVSRQALEDELGRPVYLPTDLTKHLVSSLGQVDVSAECVRWTVRGES